MSDSDKKPKRVGEALILAARLHRQRTADRLIEIGLYPGQDRALETLAASGAVTMGELAASLSIKPPTASKMIARLSEQGLVAREGADGDARRVRVALTGEGSSRVALLPEIARQVEEELTDGLDQKDRRRLRKLLRRAARNLAPAGTPSAEADDEPEIEEAAAA